MKEIDKHAYLIMCHNNFNHLCKLLTELDDIRNDIYIHIDKKTSEYSKSSIEKSVKKSKLCFVKRISVEWGGYSQVRAELILLSEATKTYHRYYHLLSGVDFPLKSQNYIHEFFDINGEKEYMSFDLKNNKNKILDRVRYYYFFQDIIGRKEGKLYTACRIIQQRYLIDIQKKMHINRVRNFSEKIYKGAQWFSITHSFACYLVKEKKEIKRLCVYGLCVDEIFVQTIAMNSMYKDRVVDNDMRYIDWKRGGPYTFTDDDFEVLTSTERLFARKFDEKSSGNIIGRLQEYISDHEAHVVK